ncbi:zinc-binding dehydrogenase [Nocardioides alcanivorans]|uniref:zinc-binding dehydrogenase n=1 Tax=Nocardioides alcanivorans TaxID=2897352 RepID=UPI001F193EF0|nr:zinc-binding dehydrogenase [Nocardioides alcanivorans]
MDAHHLLAADGLAPAQAAALSDAGLTAHHALERAFALCDRPRSEVVVAVVGVGGLGHLAVQMANLAGATTVAVDRVADKRAFAQTLGADHVLDGGPEAAAAVRELTSGRGCDVVLDLVAVRTTLDLAAGIVARNGVISVVGVSADRLPVGMHALPLGTRTDLPFWGTRDELAALVERARAGLLRVEVEEHSLDGAAAAYARLERGSVLGRAVITL